MKREFKVDANVGKPQVPTAKPSAAPWNPKVNSCANPAAGVSTDTCG